jgi:KDO2-lipid IV(A) lauroyltransferase
MKIVLDLIAYVAVRSLAMIAQILTPDSAASLARFLAWVAADLVKVRRRVIEENLSVAFPEASAADRQRLTRRMWEHLFLLGYEILLTERKIHETNWREFVRLENHRDALRFILAGRPVVLVTGHFGNFEIGGYALALLGVPLCTVARPIDNPFLDRYLSRFRTASGQIVVAKIGATEKVDQLAREGKTVAFLADQAAGPKGCFVDFFGRKASTFKAVSLLSLAHEAPLVVCYALRVDRPFQFVLRVAGIFDPKQDRDPPHDVPSVTQWFTRLLEDGIRQKPEQYWWLHRRWKDWPPARELTRRSSVPLARHAA